MMYIPTQKAMYNLVTTNTAELYKQKAKTTPVKPKTWKK